MIADIQTQEVLSTATEQAVQYVIVQDADLAHVGGGTTSISF